jgi:hypothetical protein
MGDAKTAIITHDLVRNPSQSQDMGGALKTIRGRKIAGDPGKRGDSGIARRVNNGRGFHREIPPIAPKNHPSQ